MSNRSQQEFERFLEADRGEVDQMASSMPSNDFKSDIGQAAKKIVLDKSLTHEERKKKLLDLLDVISGDDSPDDGNDTGDKAAGAGQDPGEKILDESLGLGPANVGRSLREAASNDSKFNDFDRFAFPTDEYGYPTDCVGDG